VTIRTLDLGGDKAQIREQARVGGEAHAVSVARLGRALGQRVEMFDRDLRALLRLRVGAARVVVR
jgi:phosphoenolpyruvate-protein kinase (PTS system EI component)